MSDIETPIEGNKESPTLTNTIKEGENIDTATEVSEIIENDDNGWWGSWITAAKSKSVEVLGMVKKDLDELSTAVKCEASHVINTTSSAIGKTLKLDEPESTANTMRKSLSSFLDQVNTVLNPSPDDDETETILQINGDHVSLPTYQRDLRELQKLDATYLLAPEGQALASMAAWLETTSHPSPAVIEKHLNSSSILQEKVERLVPHAVTQEDFWERYLFRKALLEDKLAQINRISPPNLCSDPIVNSVCPSADEKQSCSPDDSPTHSSASSGDSARSNYGSSKSRSMDFDASTTKEIDKVGGYIDEVSWETEDFASNIELTEEQQIKLLQEYENEIATNEKNRRLFESMSESPQNTSPPSPRSNSTNSSKSNKSHASSESTKNKIKKSKAETSSKISKTPIKIQTSVEKIKEIKKMSETNDSEVTNIIEDHFVVDKKRTEKKTKAKSLSEELAEKDGKIITDSASNNSDESWEKEFEIDDLM